MEIKKQLCRSIKNQIAYEIKRKLESLNTMIKEVKSIEVGINEILAEQAFDLVLYTEFNTQEDLSNYQKHPEHLKVVEYIRQVNEQRIVVDYTVD